MVFACSEASYSDVLDGPRLGSRGLSKPGQSCFSGPYFPYLWRAKGGLLSSLKILLWLNKRMMRQVNEKKRKELREWLNGGVVFSHPTLWPHGLQHTRLSCPSLSPRVCANSCPLSQWCHPAISSSVIPFSCLLSFPASESFPMCGLFASSGQSIGASALASALPLSIQNWFPLGLIGLISGGDDWWKG